MCWTDTDSSPEKLENSFCENYCRSDNRFFDRVGHINIITSYRNTYLGTHLEHVEHARAEKQVVLRSSGTAEIAN